jgi:predicted nuclease of predicted toxin-antitoxin system
MTLRFLCDHCVPTDIAEALRHYGTDVLLVREVLPVRSPDPVVLAKAQEIGAILLSLNGDFSDIVAYPPRDSGGIIAIQLHNHPEVIPQVMDRLLALFREHPEQAYYAGKLILVEPHRIRVRH